MKIQTRVMVIALLVLGVLVTSFLLSQKTFAAAGINQQLAFEGKVVLANGTNVANGTYNVEYKIYNGGTGTGGGTLAWTEDYLIGGSGGVTFTNGTFEVNLGSVNPFGTNVNWNSDTLWLSVQIGNTSSCTITTTFQSNCGGDGEMTPYIRLTAVPYAFNALELGGVAAANFGQLGNAQSWTGANTFSATAGTSIAATGAPTNVATSSLVQFGGAIASGNAVTNGGTYLGLNEPSSGAGTAADFLNFQNAGISKLKVTSAGALTTASALTVQSGGAAITGNSTIAGTLTGLTGLSSSGTITLSGLSTAGVVHNSAAGVLSTSPVVLGTDTSGSYVASVVAGTGTTVGGSASAPTVNVTYGSTSGTAAQGNTTLTCPSGSGGLSGGGTSITLGTGGTCAGLTLTSNPTFSGVITGSANTTGLEITGTPAASATSSLAQFGNAIASGNSATNGGTYLSINEPSSGAGSTADFLNFENNGTSELELTSAGALSTPGTLALTSLTQGSIPYVGASGVVSQDNTNLYYDSVNKRLGIGTNAPGYPLTISDNSASEFVNINNTTTNTAGVYLSNAGGGFEIEGLTGSAGQMLASSVADEYVFNNRSGPISLSADAAYTRNDLFIATNGNVAVGSNTTTGLFNVGTSAQFQVSSAGAVSQASGLTVLANGITVTGTSSIAGTTTLQTSGGLALLTANTTNSNVQIGSATTDTNQVNLQLDSSSNYTDAGTCSTTSSQGAMYYNTATNAIRSCINGGWEDLVSTAGLGIMLYGVVPDSGAVPGDLGSTSTAGVSGPCKVSWASATTVTVQTCVVYTGGRKITQPLVTVTLPAMATSTFTHLCYWNGTSALGPITNATTWFTTTSTTETANLPTFSANNPIACLATIKNSTGTANTIGQIFDTRPFTTSTKQFVNTSVAVAPSWITTTTTTDTTKVTTIATAASAGIAGTVVAGSSAAWASGGPNAIIAVSGPVEVEALAGVTTAYNYIETGATAGYANVATAQSATLTYNLYLGLARTTFGSCATPSATACQGSLLTYISFGQ